MHDRGTISGRVVDQQGEPPLTCILRFLRKGRCEERIGYISEGSDQIINADGNFTSHLLPPNDYILRFDGCRKTTQAQFDNPNDRFFTFFYPDANEIPDATPIAIKHGEGVGDLLVRIPIQRRFFVRGSVFGIASDDLARIFVVAYNDDGIVDGRSGSGVRLHSNDAFAIEHLPGNYTLAVQAESSTLYEHKVRVEDKDVDDFVLAMCH